MTQLFPGFIEVDSILTFSKTNTWEKALFFFDGSSHVSKSDVLVVTTLPKRQHPRISRRTFVQGEDSGKNLGRICVMAQGALIIKSELQVNLQNELYIYLHALFLWRQIMKSLSFLFGAEWIWIPMSGSSTAFQTGNWVWSKCMRYDGRNSCLMDYCVLADRKRRSPVKGGGS